MPRNLLFLGIVLFFSASLSALDLQGRLGMGATTQVANDLPALSFKIQKSRAYAFGGFIGHNNDDLDGGHALGLKLYRNFFEEPQLNFFGAISASLLKEIENGVEETGFGFDITLGPEFSFSGLESVGFSFEFGLSFVSLEETVFKTTGSSFVVSAVHFYL